VTSRDRAPRAVLLRGLGLVYAAAFLSIARQITGLVGEHGLLPAAAFLAGQRESFGVSALVRVPSVFWLGAGDHALLGAAYAGLLIAAAVAAGSASVLATGALWVLYLSFVSVGQIFFTYSWDLLLLEAGFLAVFISPGVSWRPRLAPPVLVVWLCRWLLFRALFGAGMAKLRSDACWAGLTCLPDYLETEPAPTVFAYYLHALPLPLHRIGTFMVLFSELIVPFGVFGPRRLRLVAGIITLAVRLLFLLAGNSGFWSVLLIVLAAVCFDDEAFARVPFRIVPEVRSGADGAPGRILSRAIAVICVALLGLGVVQLPELWSPTLGSRGSLEPFHLVNSYGAVEPVERRRDEVVFEGTRDDAALGDAHWVEYELPCKPGDPARAPCFPSLHPRRLDLRLWQAALGDFRREPWVIRLIDDLLRENRSVTALFARDPFAGSPPRFVRATRYRYRFAANGEAPYWRREPLGDFVRPFSVKDPALYEFLFRRGWLR
jgi:hypothetical protein